ncbi:hypothetical protein OAP14_07635 [Aliiglaciecola sp.]|nr:hypothetical protein [Aliiglaciecola sp.]
MLRRPYYLLSLLVLVSVLIVSEYLHQSHRHTPVELVVGLEPSVNESHPSEIPYEAAPPNQTSLQQNEQMAPPLAWLSRPPHYLSGKLVDHLDDFQKRFSDGEKAAGFV